MKRTLRKLWLGVAVCLCAVLLLVASPVKASAQPAFDGVVRIFGEDRYETAFYAADALKAQLGVDRFDTAVVVSGKNFPDALTGSYLAAEKNAPILMVKDSKTEQLVAYLEKNLKPGGTVYILGGLKAVSAGVESVLADYDVRRLQGSNRYETNLKIFEESKIFGGGVLVCDGRSFADSLCASALECPVLLLNGGTDRLDSSQIAFLKELDQPNFTIIGGEKAVSASLEKELAKYGQTRRIGGATRVETSALVAEAFFENPDAAVLAYSLKFPDGLCGGPLARSMNAPVLLTKKGAEAPATDFVAANSVKTAVILGGDGLIPDRSVRKIFDLSAEETVPLWQEPEYTITYVLNGGENNPANPTTYTSGAEVTLGAPTKEHYLFAGWYLEEDFQNGLAAISPEMTGDITVYAKWQGESYRVTYNLNGGENDPGNPDTYVYGQGLTLKDPQKENFTFAGWYSDKACTNAVDVIAPNATGDITLYAKWYLETLNIQQTGMDDMIWSWWYYPQVVSSGDSVFWGYTTKDGYCGIAQYNGATDTTTKTILKKGTKVDDHNGLALTTMGDGRIVCVYAGGHNSDNDMHIRISDKPGSIESFSTHIVLPSVGKTCYGQILYDQGRYYIFYRINNNSWGYRSSADCMEWSEEVVLVKSTMQYYCRFMPTTQQGLLRICMCSNPAAEDPSIRMGFLDLNTGELLGTDGKTVLGKEKITYDNFDVLLTPPEGKVQRMFDVAITAPDQVRILYTVFTNKAGTNDSIYYLYDTGVSYEICQGGKPVWDPKYQLGAAFIDADTIAAGRNALNTDYMELYVFDGESVKHSKTIGAQINTESVRNARPIVDINGKAVLWHNGYYNIKVYTDFDTDAQLYLIDQDKLVTKESSG